MYYKKDDVLRAAGNKGWTFVFSQLAPSLSYMLQNTKKRYACPVHGSSSTTKGDGLRFLKDFESTGGILCNTCGPKADGISALAFLTNTPWGEVCRDIAELLGVEPDKEVKKGSRSVAQSKQLQVVVPEPRVVSPEEVEKVRRKLDWYWDTSQEIGDELPAPIALWFKSKGCLVDADILRPIVRFKPSFPYYVDKVPSGHYFLMVVAVRDVFTGEILTIHRTYLTPDGKKAPVDDPRKTTEYLPNAVIGNMGVQIGTPIDGVEFVAEGLETALVINRVYGLPVRATLTTSVLRALQVYQGTDNAAQPIKQVVCFTDNDYSCAGAMAVDELERHLKGRCKVHSILPSMGFLSYEKGIDFSDLAVRYGDEFFPSRAALEKLVGMKLFPTQESNVPQVDHAPLNVVVGDLAVPQEELPTLTEPESVSDQPVKKKYKALPFDKLWDRAVALTTSIVPQSVRQALGAVNISNDVLQEVRFIPDLEYGLNGYVIGHFPALIIAVRDHAGSLVSVLRYYITEDGEPAPVDIPWKFARADLSKQPVDWKRSAIRLGASTPASTQLVCTDLLTAVCVMRSYRKPVLIIQPERLADFDFARSVKRLVVFAKRDVKRSEESLAIAAKKEGRDVRCFTPIALAEGAKPLSFADEVRDFGLSRGLPARAEIEKLII